VCAVNALSFHQCIDTVGWLTGRASVPLTSNQIKFICHKFSTEYNNS